MYGLGILRGLGVVAKHFADSYLDDIRWLGRRFYNPEALAVRQGPKGQGIFTVQYPEEKLVAPEEFRFLPFLLYETKEDGTKEDRCTSCGICAKVCPPQCIWIERTNDPKTGRPVPAPREFYIDIDICMNCGFCAEYCPFDAIKMDHNFELSNYERHQSHIFSLQDLLVSSEFYARTHPEAWDSAEEVAERGKVAKKKDQRLQKALAATAKPAAPPKAAPAAQPVKA